VPKSFFETGSTRAESSRAEDDNSYFGNDALPIPQSAKADF
jgi:hypothetical protein